MYRLLTPDESQLEIASSMKERLSDHEIVPSSEDRLVRVAVENRDVLGYIMAKVTDSSLDIESIRISGSSDKEPEILEFLMRALIIEARSTGEYERVFLLPKDEDRAVFEGWGFSETDGSPGYMEYLLDCCQGYCPFCRAC